MTATHVRRATAVRTGYEVTTEHVVSGVSSRSNHGGNLIGANSATSSTPLPSTPLPSTPVQSTPVQSSFSPRSPFLQSSCHSFHCARLSGRLRHEHGAVTSGHHLAQSVPNNQSLNKSRNQDRRPYSSIFVTREQSLVFLQDNDLFSSKANI